MVSKRGFALVVMAIFLVMDGSFQSTAEAAALGKQAKKQQDMFSGFLKMAKPMLNSLFDSAKGKKTAKKAHATKHTKHGKHSTHRLLEEAAEGGDEENKGEAEAEGEGSPDKDPRSHSGGTGATPTSKMEDGLLGKLPEGEVKDFFQRLKNKEDADEAETMKSMYIFLGLVAVAICLAGVASFAVARTHDANLDPLQFVNGNITGLSIAVGMASGLVFGFIDNAGLFFGMEYLDPVLSKLQNGHEPNVLAGYGNTFSDAIGAFLGTFAGKIIEDLAKHSDPTLSDYPIWTEAVGITLGCLLGIAIPRSISGDPDAKLMKEGLEHAKELGIPDEEVNHMLAKFDELDSTTDSEVKGRVRTINLQEATDPSLDDIIRDADADGNGWVSKGEVIQAMVNNKIREYRKRARELVAEKEAAGGEQNNDEADA